MNRIKDQILSMLIEHSRIIYSVISDMGVFYTNWAESYELNKENLDKKKNKMQLNEEDADAIKIRLIQDFSEAGAQGMGDYIALVLKMDNVINYALEFVDILSLIDYRISDYIKKNYHKLINEIITMSNVLKLTIKNLRDNPQDVFKNTTSIHEIENSIDRIFRGFLSELYDDQELDVRKLLRIRDSIVILEQLADRIHDIADLIRVLLYQ
ncbi:MAG: DUF47 domain-containing protein [Promethearchaeota archaeon]